MSQINLYLQFISLPTLAMILAGAIAFIAIIPRHRLWQVAILIGPAWMLAGRSSDFPLIAVYAKTLTFIPVLLLLIGLFRHPATRYPAPKVFYWLFATGFLWILCVALCSDAAYAVVIRSQWLLMTVAAGLLSGLIIWRARLDDFMVTLFFASFGAVVIMGLGLLLDPYAMNLDGHRRFSPWNTNPNQISLSLILAYTMSIYMVLSKRGTILTGLAIATGILASLMIILTLSRSAVLMATIVTIVMLWAILKQKPFISAVIVALGFLVITRYLGTDNISLDRLSNLQTTRGEIAQAYFQEIRQRPFVGLLGRSGNNSAVAADVGTHAHNVIITTLYVGGIALLILALAAWGTAMHAIAWLYINKAKFPNLTSEIYCLTALFTAFSASCFNNFVIIWPTYYEAMIFMVIGCLAVQVKNHCRALID